MLCVCHGHTAMMIVLGNFWTFIVVECRHIKADLTHSLVRKKRYIHTLSEDMKEDLFKFSIAVL